MADGGIVGRVTGSSFLDGRRELLQLEVHGESVTVVAPIGTDGVWSRRDREVRFVPTNPALFYWVQHSDVAAYQLHQIFI